MRTNDTIQTSGNLNNIAKVDDCSNSIIVNRNKIDCNDFPRWVKENENYFCISPLPEGPIHIILSKIPWDESHDARSKWLRENGKYIDFNASYAYIENVHKIKNSSNIHINPNDFFNIELKCIIETIGRNLYENDEYNNYIVVSIEDGKILFSTTKYFTLNQICYSIPFFKSLIYNSDNGINENSIFQFAKYWVEDRETILFNIKNTSYGFYDFSHIPPLHPYDIIFCA